MSSLLPPSTPLSSGLLESLLDTLYRSLLERPVMQRFCEQLREVLEVEALGLFFDLPDRASIGYSMSAGAMPESQDDIALQSWIELDPFNCDQPLQLFRLADVASGETLNAYRQDVLQAAGLKDVQAMDSSADGEIQVCLRLFFAETQELINSQHQALLSYLLPHLKNAGEIHKRLLMGIGAQEFAGQYLESLQMAAIAMEDNRNILSSNRIAKALLRKTEIFSIKQNRLRLKSKDADAQLQTAIENTYINYLRSGDYAVYGFKLYDNAGEPLVFLLKAAPQPDKHYYTNPAIMMLVGTNQTGVQISKESLKEIYGFTNAEANLAVVLAEGWEPSQAAEKLGVSIHTVRTQIRALLAKTDVDRLADLLTLLWKFAI